MKSLLIKNCLQCKKEIRSIDYPRPAKFLRTKYCSSECYRETRRGSKNNMWKGGQIEISCVTCKSTFKVDPYLKKQKTCSRTCNLAYRKSPEFRLKQSQRARKQILGQYGSNPKFITKLSQIIRESAKYRLWREEVWKRDNYTCQMCLEQKGKICADHIISFLKILLDEKVDSYDKAMESGVLWDINNGRTLCYDCHYKTENYGFKAIKLSTNK